MPATGCARLPLGRPLEPGLNSDPWTAPVRSACREKPRVFVVRHGLAHVAAVHLLQMSAVVITSSAQTSMLPSSQCQPPVRAITVINAVRIISPTRRAADELAPIQSSTIRLVEDQLNDSAEHVERFLVAGCHGIKPVPS